MVDPLGMDGVVSVWVCGCKVVLDAVPGVCAAEDMLDTILGVWPLMSCSGTRCIRPQVGLAQPDCRAGSPEVLVRRRAIDGGLFHASSSIGQRWNLDLLQPGMSSCSRWADSSGSSSFCPRRGV